MMSPKSTHCADCKSAERKALMYRIRPPKDKPVFWMCQACWDRMIGSAVFQFLR